MSLAISERPEPALSIVEVMRNPATAEWVREHGNLVISVNNTEQTIDVVSYRSGIGRQMRLFVCPMCRVKRARMLWAMAGVLGCQTCHHVVHEDHALSGSWGRGVLLSTRQLRRVDERLARPGPDRITRQRLRRRRARLLRRLQEALDQRQDQLQEHVEQVLQELNSV